MDAKPLPTAPPGHRYLETEDGSWTVVRESIEEGAHSRSGAWSETMHHYVDGCRIGELALKAWGEKRSLRIFETGFGVGIGWWATLHHLTSMLVAKMLVTNEQALLTQPILQFFSTEYDPHLAQWTLEHGATFYQTYYEEKLKTANSSKVLLTLIERECRILSGESEQGEYWRYRYQLSADQKPLGLVELILFIGDGSQLIAPSSAAFELLPLNGIDAFYQDAYSPKKSPELWGTAWFEALDLLARTGARLATYSTYKPMREALVKMQWEVSDGPAFGPKRSSTRAIKKRLKDN